MNNIEKIKTVIMLIAVLLAVVYSLSHLRQNAIMEKECKSKFSVNLKCKGDCKVC